MELTKHTRILIVEDDEDDSFLLTRQLAKAQIDDHVTIITKGEDAYDFLLTSPILPIAVFLDLRLEGGLSGLDLLEKIRTEPRLKDVPVIIMTGSNSAKDMENGEKLGVTAYLLKPVPITTFIKTIAHLFPKVEAAR
jgi:two-component system response regulator